MWNSRPVRLLGHGCYWLTRAVLWILASSLVLFALSILVLRYLLLPNIEQYHEKITASLSQTMGRNVTIDKILGDWQGLQPRLSLVNLAILDERQQVALALPNVHVSISWLSLVTAELRLASLEIDKPELLIRRASNGQMFLGSVALDTQGGGNSNMADWLLRQSRMVARDALIVWVDEQRGAPPLVLQKVNLRIESLLNHHHLVALRADAPTELATPLDVRGDFVGTSFANLSAWQGQVFAQLRYTDIAAWRAWFNLPSELSRGRGGVRAWLDVKAGKLTQLQVDLAVRDVATKLADDVPEMTLNSLQGRATWRGLPTGFELQTKRLTMQLDNGVALPTTDLYVRSLDAQENVPASGEIRANLLQLETLVSLSNFVPIPAALRAHLVEYAPRGKVANLNAQWQGSAQKISAFAIKGEFQNIALHQVGKLPGFTGLTAVVEGDQKGGKVQIKSIDLAIDAPGVMRESVAFNHLTAVASWQHLNQELQVKVDELVFNNSDITGRALGSYHTLKDTPGVLDLSLKLSHANVHQAARYIPLVAASRGVNDWLHDALLAGTSSDFKLHILGNLKDFPFDQDKLGEFDLQANLQGGAVRFAKDWPIVEKANGKLLMHGKKLEVQCVDARSGDVALHEISVLIPDITAVNPMLETKLHASDSSRNFLQYVQLSPVRGYTKNFTDPIVAQGNGELDLTLHIPRLGENLIEVQGVYALLNNEVNLARSIPLLHNVNGALHFTQKGFNSQDLTAEVLGGVTQIEAATLPAGGVSVNLAGTVNLTTVATLYPHPVFNYLQGKMPWNGLVAANSGGLQVHIQSDLQGVTSTLPQPLSKAQNVSLPLSVDWLKPSEVIASSALESQPQSTLQIVLGNLVRAQIIPQVKDGRTVIKRASIHFGDGGAWAKQDGVWLNGTIAALSLQGWDALLKPSDSVVAEQKALPFDGADLHIEALSGYGHSIKNLHLVANKRGDSLLAQLESAVINGEVIWQPHGYHNEARLVANLKSLNWATEVASVANTPLGIAHTGDLPSTSAAILEPGKLPALDVMIDQLQVSGKKLGRLELAGHGEGDSWRLRRLILTNPDGGLSGDGVWLGGAGKPQTKINLTLEISDAGKILDRSGYPNTVKEGNGKLAANVAWVGAPEAFNLASLSGTLKLDTGKGQFLKLDSTVNKLSSLLSVLSLQALPKHISLGFTDVFSEGFPFDNINGNANISQGSLTTQDFHIDGAAAKIKMRGRVDLIRETQDLRVEVLPSIGSGVSLIGVLAINPVVGLSAFVVDKLLGSPLDKLVSFEYNIGGTWADPTVLKVGEKVVPKSVNKPALPDSVEPNKKVDLKPSNPITVH